MSDNKLGTDVRPVLATEFTPIPVNGCWKPGPTNGNDPLDRDMIECGDRFLVLVNCVQHRGSTRERNYWDAHVIVATEDGWNDSNGKTWGAWDWSDVSWYLELTRQTMPQL